MLTRLVLVLVGVVLSGCVAGNGNSLSGVKAVKGAPVVYVHPMGGSYRHGSIGVLPFQMPENMTRAQGLGVAALFKDVLLGKRTFKAVKQLEMDFGTLDEAVLYGKQQNLDLVLAGRVNYAISGTELGGARVDVSVRLLNVETGNTIWYVGQTMDQPVDYPDVNLLNRIVQAWDIPQIRRSAGAPAVPNMLAKIAVDMADVFSGAATVPR